MFFGKKRAQAANSNIDKRRLETRDIFAECQRAFPDTTENEDRFDTAAQVVIDCFVAKLGAPELEGEWWNISPSTDEERTTILTALDRLRDMFNVNDSGLMDKHFPELSRIYLVGSLNTEVVDQAEFLSAIDSILLWGGVDQILDFIQGGLGELCLAAVQRFTSPRPSLEDILSTIDSRKNDFTGKTKAAYKSYGQKLAELDDSWQSEKFLSSSFSEIIRHLEEDVDLPLDMSAEAKSLLKAFNEWETTFVPVVKMAKPMKFAPKTVENSFVWSELYNDENCVGYLVPGFVPEEAIGYYICRNPWADDNPQQRVLTEIYRFCAGCDGAGEADGEECLVCQGEGEEIVTANANVLVSFDRADELNAYLEEGIPNPDEPDVKVTHSSVTAKFCSSCGNAFGNNSAKFCVECGALRG